MSINNVFTHEYTTKELANFKEILSTLAQGNIVHSRDLFKGLNASEISRFHHFRNRFRNLERAEQLKFIKPEETATAMN